MEPTEVLTSQVLNHPLTQRAFQLLLLMLLCVLVDVVVRRMVIRAVRRLASRSENRWDDALVEARFFSRVSHIAPTLVAYFGVQALDVHDSVDVVIQSVAMALLVAFIALAISSILTAANIVYTSHPSFGDRPIKGYLSFVRLLVYLVAGLLAVSALMHKSPLIFLSGIGAMMAVLLLVFKDTLLSLVASVQITSNDMIRVGDWVEMPAYGADGDVIDVALYAVTIQNWDKTISMVPTHAFISGSFKNWRGMSESKSRRIKRSLYIDIASIRFLDEAEIDRFGRFALLRDYVAEKRASLDEWNSADDRDPAISADIRRLTNVGTYRQYVLAYLRAHPRIHEDRTLLVRQLGPSPEGLPIEIYCFTNDIVWANYEDIQSDIFDHLLAVAPEFGLRIFQRPTGADLKQAGELERAGGVS